MSLDPIKKLGRAIAGISNEQVTLQQNISAEDSAGLLQLAVSEQMALSGSITLVSKYLTSSTFQIGNPVQGLLGDTRFYLDGGYNEALSSTIFSGNW
jgi:hypothetical protein